MHSRAAAVVFVALLSAEAVSVQLWAQSGEAAVSGTVSGPSGAVLPDAKVSAKNLGTGQFARTQTDWKGFFNLQHLAPGDYEVSASAQGFSPRTVRVTLAAGVNQTSDMVLTAAPAQTAGPSLEDLGFKPSQTQGSSQYQSLLDRRSHMLQVHQRLGLITTAPLLATLITAPGAKGHHGLPGNASGRELHAALGSTTAALYFTSAYFAIRAPTIPGIEVKGPIRVHKALAWIHGPGMILTPILGAIAYSQLSNGERVHGIAKYHSWVAWTTAGAYGPSIAAVSIRF